MGTISLGQLIELGSQHAGTIEEHVHAPVFVPETLSGMELLEQFRTKTARMVLVVDEYGDVQGLITPNDMLEAITGELQPYTPVDAWATPRDDGSWLIDGAMPVGEFKSRLDIAELPDEERGRYNTVAGLLMAVSGSLPAEGDKYRMRRLEVRGRRPRRAAHRQGAGHPLDTRTDRRFDLRLKHLTRQARSLVDHHSQPAIR